MTFDQLRQDLRHAVRSLLRSPAFTAVTILTLALGIGANTAIFSIVNGVILRPLGYPKPEQLMYLTTQFPAFGFEQFWVSPPEYFEFREINQSFASVGAFTTGEVNLTAGDRPLRVRSASVNDDLMNALGVQPAIGRLFSKGETDLVGPPPTPGAPPIPLPPFVLLSHELWQSAFGGQDIVGQTVEVNGLPREVIGIMPPGADVMDNRTEIWLPLGLNPGNRQNRGNHFLYLIGRLKDGVTPQAAQTELAALIQNWGERVGVKNHVFAPPSKNADGTANPGSGHILQMEPVQEEIVGGASRAIWVLQAAVGFVLLIACANLANLLLARAEHRHREFAVRTALGAGRGRLLRQFMTEGVLLSIVGGLLGLVLARAGVQALIRVYPTSLPRTTEVTVDPLVLLFTFGVSIATGLVFGLAPLMHTRMSGLMTALKEGGAKGATGAARHHVRRGLVMAEVALAVMLVIGAGLMLRTVANLTNVDAGFDRARLVTFSMALPTADYPQPLARAQMYQRLLGKIRAMPGVQGATAMSGLPPNRPLNANDTDIDNYTAPPEGPFENVDYYQNVMTDYFETMGMPIVQGRAFQSSDAASSGMVAVVNETLVNTFWKGQNPIGQRLRPCCGDKVPWFTVVGVAKDVKQGGVDQRDRHRVLFPRGPDRAGAAAARPGAGHDERRPADHTRTGGAAAVDRAGGARGGSVGTDRPSARHERRVRGIDPAAAPARAAARRLCRAGAAARGDRHLRRSVVHGRRASPGDRHSHGARRGSVERARAGVASGPRADVGGYCRRSRWRVCTEPADPVAALRRAADGSDDAWRRRRDDHARRRGCLLAAGLAGVADGPQHRPQAGVAG